MFILSSSIEFAGIYYVLSFKPLLLCFFCLGYYRFCRPGYFVLSLTPSTYQDPTVLVHCAHQVAAISACLEHGLAHFGLDCRFWKANFSLALDPAIPYSAICNLQFPLHMPAQNREMHVRGLDVWGDKVYVYVTSDKASPCSYCFRNS